MQEGLETGYLYMYMSYRGAYKHSNRLAYKHSNSTIYFLLLGHWVARLLVEENGQIYVIYNVIYIYITRNKDATRSKGIGSILTTY